MSLSSNDVDMSDEHVESTEKQDLAAAAEAETAAETAEEAAPEAAPAEETPSEEVTG